jgi:hypothetical protein
LYTYKLAKQEPDMSTSQKKQTKAVAEVTKEHPVKDTAPVTPPSVPSPTTATHSEAADIHATEAKNKAAEAGGAAKDSASEASLVSCLDYVYCFVF